MEKVKRVNGVREKRFCGAIVYVGYARFFREGKYFYQISSPINRIERKEARQDAEQLASKHLCHQN
jgi:hypothetical protein